MANVLKLKRSATDLTFLAAADAGLRAQKWYPKMADIVYGGVPPFLIEELDILIDRASHDNLATSFQALDQMRRWAQMYEQDRLVDEPVWFHAKMDNETYERRAYVRRIRGEWRTDQIESVNQAAVSNAIVRLRIERHPYWEALLQHVGTQTQGLTGPSMIFDYTSTGGDIVGDVMARSQLQIDPGSTGSAADNIGRLWIGVRSTKFGTPGNFAPIWELESSSSTGADTSAAADATASPGGAGNTKRTVSFATTPGWAMRVKMELNDQTANDGDNVGRMLWLLRTKVTAGTTCEVRLKYGFYPEDTSTYNELDIVEVSNSSWDIKEMGQCRVPPHLASGILWAHDPGKFTIEVWARRTGGSGSLDLDCLCPIPLDEGWLVAEDVGSDDTLRPFYYAWTEYDAQLAWREHGGGILGTIAAFPYSTWNLGFPPGDGRLVVAFADDTDSTLADEIRITTHHWPRWANLRGSEKGLT